MQSKNTMSQLQFIKIEEKKVVMHEVIGGHGSALLELNKKFDAHVCYTVSKNPFLTQYTARKGRKRQINTT